jgi:hypothetical protein
MNRKQLFETLTANGASEDAEPRRLALASDLRWLISEGYLIEFNDGSLDRPRVKPKQQSPETSAVAVAVTTIKWQLQLTWPDRKQLL